MMILLDKPYISRFLLDTASRLDVDVLQSAAVEQVEYPGPLKVLDDLTAVKKQKELPYPHVYCNSENSLHWIADNLSFTNLPDKIELFKNKVKFRQLLEPVYPDYFYQEVPFERLADLDISQIKKPFVIKPSVGFFSMGVNIVANDAQWRIAVSSIQEEMKRIRGLYPLEVMDSSTFIVEEVIEGEEFAIDAYFNDAGEPVILNILHHVFCSDQDVSDRIYLTSKSIISDNYARFFELLEHLGRLVDLKNFPMHVEVRVSDDGRCLPIEVNPMRFAGWCTADIADFAYGINVYEYYFQQRQPDWKTLLETRNGEMFGIVVADVPKSLDNRDIVCVDYDGFLANFSNPLEVRPIDYHEYPVFAFLFINVPESRAGEEEIDRIMKLDFGDYIQTSN